MFESIVEDYYLHFEVEVNVIDSRQHLFIETLMYSQGLYTNIQ